MGLIKAGIKYGTLGYVAHQGFKAFGEHKQQQSQPQSAPPQQPYYPQQQPQQQQPQSREVGSGYLHQTWCNGQCGYHCNDGNNLPRYSAGEAQNYYTGAEKPQ